MGSAIRLLIEELQFLETPDSQLQSRNAKRLQLALVDAHLMKAVKLQSISLESESMSRAMQLLESLEEDFKETAKLRKIGRMNYVRIRVSIAIIEHLRGSLGCALERWNEAQEASRKDWPEGYTDVVINYSKSELRYRLGHSDHGRELEQAAIDLYQMTGRQYHFTFLGSIWLDYIGGLIGLHGGRQLE